MNWRLHDEAMQLVGRATKTRETQYGANESLNTSYKTHGVTNSQRPEATTSQIRQRSPRNALADKDAQHRPLP